MSFPQGEHLSEYADRKVLRKINKLKLLKENDVEDEL